jgi:hypothetical protein
LKDKADLHSRRSKNARIHAAGISGAKFQNSTLQRRTSYCISPIAASSCCATPIAAIGGIQFVALAKPRGFLEDARFRPKTPGYLGAGGWGLVESGGWDLFILFGANLIVRGGSRLAAVVCILCALYLHFVRPAGVPVFEVQNPAVLNAVVGVTAVFRGKFVRRGDQNRRLFCFF